MANDEEDDDDNDGGDDDVDDGGDDDHVDVDGNDDDDANDDHDVGVDVDDERNLVEWSDINTILELWICKLFGCNSGITFQHQESVAALSLCLAMPAPVLSVTDFFLVPLVCFLTSMEPETDRLLCWQAMQEIVVGITQVSDTTFVKNIREPNVLSAANVLT